MSAAILVGVVIGVLASLVLESLRARLVVEKHVASLEARRLERRKRHKQGWTRVHDTLDVVVSLSQQNRVAAEQTRIQTDQLLLSVPKQASQEQLQSPAADVDSLKRIPGVGDVLARKLLEKFGSLDQIREAPIEELAEIDGIGPRLAQRIAAALG